MWILFTFNCETDVPQFVHSLTAQEDDVRQISFFSVAA